MAVKSPFAPRKQGNFRGAKGDDVEPCRKKRGLWAERPRSLKRKDPGALCRASKRGFCRNPYPLSPHGVKTMIRTRPGVRRLLRSASHCVTASKSRPRNLPPVPAQRLFDLPRRTRPVQPGSCSQSGNKPQKNSQVPAAFAAGSRFSCAARPGNRRCPRVGPQETPRRLPANRSPIAPDTARAAGPRRRIRRGSPRPSRQRRLAAR